MTDESVHTLPASPVMGTVLYQQIIDLWGRPALDAIGQTKSGLPTQAIVIFQDDVEVEVRFGDDAQIVVALWRCGSVSG